MKRRVIAIAVVLAAVTVACRAGWEPLWRAVALKRTVEKTADDYVEIKYRWRWGQREGKAEGSIWRYSFGQDWLERLGMPNKFVVHYTAHQYGGAGDGVITYYDSHTGKVLKQTKILRPRVEGRVHDKRTSPPWWPHPPLIDLRDFEE